MSVKGVSSIGAEEALARGPTVDTCVKPNSFCSGGLGELE